MGAGKLRVLAVRGSVVAGAIIGVAALAVGCGSVSAAPPGAAAQGTPPPAPKTVPVLGRLDLGSFPATLDGGHAKLVCQEWAGLRGGYVTRLGRDTPFQLEQWISTSPQWAAAFSANSPLKTDAGYTYVNTAFGLVSTAAAASVDNARLMDGACAHAD
jgi:hypothetical protein